MLCYYVFPLADAIADNSLFSYYEVLFCGMLLKVSIFLSAGTCFCGVLMTVFSHQHELGFIVCC